MSSYRVQYRLGWRWVTYSLKDCKPSVMRRTITKIRHNGKRVRAINQATNKELS